MSKLKRVSEVMSTPTYSVNRTTPLEEVDELLEEYRISALAVTNDDGGIAGVISRADLIHRALTVEPKDGTRTLVLPEIRVEHAMTPNPICVARDDSVARAAMLMADARVHRVFVTDGDNLEGVVTAKDVMSVVAEEHLSVRLEDCMMPKLISVARGASVKAAVELITSASEDGLLVEDAGYPVGILTIEELLLAQHWPPSIAVEEFMYARPLCLPKTMALHRAAAFALMNDVRHVVVVDDHGVQGMVASLDFVRAYARAYWASEQAS